MAADYLGEFEHLVLLAALQLGSDASGVPIRRLIAERAERRVSFGAVYSTLRRLDAKGLITVKEPVEDTKSIGRPRRTIKVTAKGRAAVTASQRRLRRMAEGINKSERTAAKAT
jgi:DNA-binding PadR family transcriptional regulator